MTGLRYTNFSLPAGAQVTNADIQFTADETSNTTSNLTIKGESTANALAYGSAYRVLSPKSLPILPLIPAMPFHSSSQV